MKRFLLLAGGTVSLLAVVGLLWNGHKGYEVALAGVIAGICVIWLSITPRKPLGVRAQMIYELFFGIGIFSVVTLALKFAGMIEWPGVYFASFLCVVCTIFYFVSFIEARRDA